MPILSYLRQFTAQHSCPACGTQMGQCRLTLLSKDRGRVTVKATCLSCSSAYKMEVLFIEGDVGVGEAPPPGLPPVSADEVITAHEILKRHDGDLVSLFLPSST